jgi:adenylate cyclase
MASLEVVEGYNVGERFLLEDEALIGRSLSNSICLPDSRASRQHARICKGTDGAYYLEDLGSANGTLLSNVVIPANQPKSLQDGDLVQICSTQLVFHQSAPTRQAEEPEPGAAPHQSGERNRDLGGLSVLVADGAEGGQPSVNAALDARRDMGSVDERERQSDQGMREALRRLQAICQVSEALGNILDLTAVMDRVLETVFDVFPAADRAFIMLKTGENNELEPVAARRRREGSEDVEEAAISRTIIQEVVDNRRSILSSDAMSDDRFTNQVSVMNLSIRSMMCAPLLCREEILGLIQVDTQKGIQSFTEGDLQVLTGIGAQAAIAVRNAQLYEAVEIETSRRTSLQRYFSPNMVEMMMSGRVDEELSGNLYQGTVFFSDIIGFTSMSEAMAPAEVVANLNRYFTVMQKLIYDNRGNVDKFGGDAIMAFWSVPRRECDDELRALLTGVQMQTELWNFNLSLERSGQPPIRMGVGVNTGRFVAGNVGSEDKIEFTLIGDDVNLAARIEERAGRSQVFAAHSTWAAVEKNVCAILLPPVIFRGRSQPSLIYSIRGVRLSEADWALNLPCRVGNHDDSLSMLTGLSCVDGDPQLLLSTRAELRPGEVVPLQIDCPEYHEQLILNGTVRTRSEVETGQQMSCARVVLADLEGRNALELLRPGSCLKTERKWAEMPRQ